MLRAKRLTIFVILIFAVTVQIGSVLPTMPTQRASPFASVTPAPWPMFHRDERHTGVAPGTGNINPATGPVVRWTYQVTQPPGTAAFATYRWYASFPLGDLDGDGTLEVVVTTPDNSGEPDRVIALKDTPGQMPPVRAMWVYTGTHHAGAVGFDQYSAALADADGDSLLDVLFTSKDGYVRALKGTTGQLIWEYQTNHFIEAGPMVADLDGDGTMEVIVVTDCQLGANCPGSINGGSLYVFSAIAPGGGSNNPPLWSQEYPYKLDSAEPAAADLDPDDGQNRKALIIGSWGSRLLVVWRNANGTIVTQDFDIRTLDNSVAHDAPAVIRSSPLVADFGNGLTAVFGWMPDWQVGSEARISAVWLRADSAAGTVAFTPRWTVSRDAWKSSVALLPVGNAAPLVVVGYGIGTTQGTGNYGLCDPPMGGVVAVNAAGQVAWDKPLQNEGNVRASPAVADIDGDGQLEVALTVGCYGKLYAYDGLTGNVEWGFQLGPRTIGSPAIADLDGDGTLEIVASSYDGKVYALGGGTAPVTPSPTASTTPHRFRLPLIVKGQTGTLPTPTPTSTAVHQATATPTASPVHGQTPTVTSTPSATVANVVVNTNQRYQTFIGWSTLSRRWDAPHLYYGPNQGLPIDRVPANVKEQVLDVLYTNLRLDAIEVVLQGGAMDPSYQAAPSGWRSHEPLNDNADPFVLNRANMDFAYWPPHLEIVKKAFDRIRARGDTPRLFLRVGGTEAWMRHQSTGQHLAALDPNQVDEFVEWIVALILYFRDDHELTVDYVSVTNEPDGAGAMSPDLLALAARRLDERLRALALPTRVAVPETVTPRAAVEAGRYLDALENVGVADDLGLINYHIYDYDASVGTLPDLDARRALRAFGREHGVPTFMTELGSDVKANRRTFWLDTPEQALAWANDFVTELTETDAAGITLMWNFWTDSNPNFGTDAYVILEFDEANDYQFVQFRTPIFYEVLGRFVNAIRPGMVRVAASTTIPDVRVVAFVVMPALNQLVVAAINNGSVARAVTLPNGGGGVVPAHDVRIFTGPLP